MLTDINKAKPPVSWKITLSKNDFKIVGMLLFIMVLLARQRVQSSWKFLNKHIFMNHFSIVNSAKAQAQRNEND